MKSPIQSWPGYQACSIYSSGTITYLTTVCSASTLVEESSDKLEVLQSQLKLMLETPGRRLIAVLWKNINFPSLVVLRESTGGYFSYVSVLSAFRNVPQSLEGREIVPSLGSLYIVLCMLGKPFPGPLLLSTFAQKDHKRKETSVPTHLVSNHGKINVILNHHKYNSS